MNAKTPHPQRILIVNPFGIGDAIFSMYVMESYAAANPGAEFGFVCNERTIGLAEANVRVKHCHIFNRDHWRAQWKRRPLRAFQEFVRWVGDIRRNRYDAALDFSMGREYSFLLMLAGIRKRIGLDYKRRGAFLTGRVPFDGYGDRHVVCSQLQTLSWLGGSGAGSDAIATPQFHWPDGSAQAEATKGFVLAIVPGGGRSWGANAHYKQWPVEKFAAAAAKILKEQPSESLVVLLGDETERELVEDLRRSLPAQTRVCVNAPLREAAAWLKRANLVLANDGGLFHLSTVLRRPTVGIFGPVDERLYGPFGSDHRSITVSASVECRPCYKDFKFPPCPHDKRCLLMLEADVVAEKALALLAPSQKNSVMPGAMPDFARAIERLDRESDEVAERYARSRRKTGVFGAFLRAQAVFNSAFAVNKTSSALNVPGLFGAVQSAATEFLGYAKYWARTQSSEIPSRTLSKRNGAAQSRLSVVIMTKNSEALIEGCLQSASWADEIVIWDGHSTDRTLEICRKYTDKIFQSPFSGSFGEERNRATARATGDWCLHIDPDERLTEEFKQAVEKILSGKPLHQAYEFRKKNIFLGHWMRYGGWHHYSLHFFRRGAARYEGIVHENLRVEGSIGKIEASVEHYPFVSFTQFLNRHNRYSTLEAREEFERHGRLSADRIRYELTRKPVKRFFKFYVKKRGFLDGTHGLIFCTLYAWVHFLNWAKYWEMTEVS